MSTEAQALKNEHGEIVVTFPKINQEGHEMLKALRESPYWKYYRQMLIQAKEAQSLALLPLDDPNKMMKQVGYIAGMNYCINQLGVLVDHHETQVKRKLAEEERKAARSK